MNKNAIYNQLFEFTPNKSQLTKIQIAEAAIKNYVHRGLEQTTYGEIAKSAKLSRTIVNRYFPRHEELLKFTAQYIRANYQQFVIEDLVKEKSTEEQLRAYLGSAMEWVHEFPDHAHAWLLIFYYCGIRKEFRRLNTDLVEMGLKRLTALIAKGIDEKVFRVKDVEKIARQIHLSLSGAILALMTEDAEFNSKTKRNTIDFCINFLKEKSFSG